VDKPNWTEVEGSSNIAAIDYTAGSPETDLGTLYVRFSSGAEYRYLNVPNQLAEDFFESESKGKFFHANIRRADFSGSKLQTEDPDSEVELLAKQAEDLGMLDDDEDAKADLALAAEEEGAGEKF